MGDLKLIHIDRGRRLHKGDVLPLDRSGYDGFDYIHMYYPTGISAHGHRWMFLDSLQKAISCADSAEEAARRAGDFLIEQVFEAVRISEYSHCLSRFQAVFAVANDDIARAKTLLHAPEESRYWQIQCARFEKYDMTWLHSGDFASVYHRAHMYWQEKASDEPLWEYLCEMPVKIIRSI